jgi:quercetin dioxygenase-like cupin family protein
MSGAQAVSLTGGSWRPVKAHVSEQVVHGAAMSCTRYRFGPGAWFPPHQHAQEQVTYVISGRMTYTLPDGDHVVEADSLVVVPAGMPHSGRAGPAGAELLCVVSPSRIGSTGIELLR